jgi:hypothetical protein
MTAVADADVASVAALVGDRAAGRAGTALRDTLLTSRILTPDGDRDFRLTDRGLRFLGNSESIRTRSYDHGACWHGTASTGRKGNRISQGLFLPPC